ncbi:MAG TPA: glucose-1-phosphate thymidylyltransferase [Candidatus Magasanikbacteria bacterium]|nr:glucose-1-phosphate thymidylyltransferase [Candidatus Magasanikbacteria bacterium]
MSLKKIRKAILTGGGRATRLRPVTSTINKHLIPLANKPMIFHAIQKVVDAGVEEIFINLNPGDTELAKYIGDGGHWGIKITYFEQEGGPQGVAHVVKQAQKFIGNDPFIFFLSDNVVLGDIKPMVAEFTENKYDCMLALSEVPNAKSFGVPVFDENKKLVDVWEKPENPPNNFAVTGIYIYGPDVFFKAFDNIEKSARGEYEISSIHSHFLKNDYKVGYKEITGWWKDTGQAHDLILANKLLLDELKDEEFVIQGKVEEGATLTEKVHIGAGTIVRNDVKIKGPTTIGENCILENCVIGPYATIGSGCVIKNAEVNNSIILKNCTIDCQLKFTESIVGEKAEVVKKRTDECRRIIIGEQTVIEV